ncbi:MAG: hypothetical protein ACYCYH_03740 [Steroidobacteraceae bacterium]
MKLPKNIHIEDSAAHHWIFSGPALTSLAEDFMISADTSPRKSKAKDRPYKLIKIQTTEGKESTVSLDKTLYEVIESKVGAEAAITVARKAARRFETAKTDKTRSAYVVQALRSTFGVGRTGIDASQKAKSALSRKYTYAKLRVRDAQGGITTVSMPPLLIARARRKLTDEQIQAIADAAAAAYDKTSIFTRSESIKRALKEHLGDRVPSELQVFRRKFRITSGQLASMLQVSAKDVAQWEERGEIDSGPARIVLAMLWRRELKLSTVLKRRQPV